MGLMMNDLHNPSVPSAAATQNGASRSQKPLMELISEKDRIESELTALGSVLDSHNVNMNTSLTTFDGFPRDDIDVAQIRTTRARIIHLKNDYKAIMADIEKGLHAYHAGAQKSGDIDVQASRGQVSGSSSISAERNATNVVPDTVFAKVNSVVTGSPADEAGLQAGDEVLQFGDVHWMNHEKLSRVAQTVQRNEGRSITVRVLRKGTDGRERHLQLTLTPRSNWGGRGMLGCHLLPN